MSLTLGSRLGAYEVTAAIGAGGMGEVYRARDTKLNRDVAIKVLPSSFSKDAERMARFQREAQVLAALNHPNIAQVFGLVEGDGAALVMEFVPGETLRGPVPLDEATAIARQIAEALETAHEKGIVHRDLKPANIKITPDGKVKVLDFGLAKAMEDTPTDIANSPTLSLGATRAGVILGTAAYMAPEQAKGKAADRRADVWSFGVVLLEMLTGQRAFQGENASEVMAGVILKEPAIPAGLPPHIEQLLRRCLNKDPRQRLQAIGEARILLEAGASTVPAVPAATMRSSYLPWAIAGAMGLLAMLALVLLWPKPHAAAPVRRTTIQLGADAALYQVTTPLVPVFDLSPDGTMLVFVGVKAAGEKPQLYLRRLDQLKANAMSGTDGARNPFFSADSQWVAFYAEGKLRKVSITGGAPVTLCEVREGLGGHWAEDGMIVFAPNRFSALMRVPSVGGLPQAITKIDPNGGENAHRWPQTLPGGKAVLYSSGMALNFGAANLVIQVLASGETKIVQRGAYYGRYVPSGHLVFLHEGSMFAATFDLDRLELTSQPVPILEDVQNQSSGGAAQFAFARDGTLVYSPSAGPSSGARSLTWMDRSGKTTPLRQENSLYFNFRFSPDGRSLAMSVPTARGFDTWIYQLERGTMSRLSAEAIETSPIWTPDGRRITYRAQDPQSRAANIYWRPADGTGEAQRLTEGRNPQSPNSWHPSGKFLAYSEIPKIMILPMEGSDASGWKPGKPYDFVANAFLNGGATFSPDGRWLAYYSTETSREEVYVQAFPGPGGRWQISNEGGTQPVWSATSKELLYRAANNIIMVSGYSESGGAFQAGKPRPWAENQPAIGGGGFDLHPDGKRLAIARGDQQLETKALDHLVLFENFFDELRKSASGKK